MLADPELVEPQLVGPDDEFQILVEALIQWLGRIMKRHDENARPDPIDVLTHRNRLSRFGSAESTGHAPFFCPKSRNSLYQGTVPERGAGDEGGGVRLGATGEGLGSPVLWQLGVQRSRDPTRAAWICQPSALFPTFLAFLGAKKGEFFGVEAKKVGRGPRAVARPVGREHSADSSNSFAIPSLRKIARL